jgi:calcineurin-like phosphoesterase family protein
MKLNPNVVFVSDLHLGHKNILKHSDAVAPGLRGGTTVEEHDEWVIEQCLKVKPTKRTLWYIMGDVAMEIERLSLIDRLPGRKILIPGNHDLFQTPVYLKYFEKILGGFKKYGFWITHMPLHEKELRGKCNLHGHCHHNTLKDDPRYLNAAIEWLPDKRPITLDEVKERFSNV